MGVVGKISFVALLFAASLGYTEDQNDVYAKEEEKEEREKKEKKEIEKKLDSLANSYIPALKNSIDVWAHVDLIYFVPKIRSMAYTTEPSFIPSTTDFSSTGLVRPDFQWSPGYQAGVGYRFRKTKWDIAFDATHFHSRVHKSKSLDNQPLEGMFPVWSVSDSTIPGDYVSYAKISGKLLYDSIRLHAGYFWLGESRYVFKISIGLQNIWLKQHYDIEYSGGIFTGGTDHIHMKNNFWGVGPRIEINPWVFLGKGWAVYTKAAAMYLTGTFNVHQQETYLEEDLYDEHRHLVRGRFGTDVEAGAEWKYLFYHDRFSFAIRLGWEYLVYYRQNEFKKGSLHVLDGNGGVQMQGGLLSVRLDF